jgi:nitrate/nitrite sensing protein
MTDNRNRRIQAALRGVGRSLRFALRSHPLTWSLASLVAGVTAATVVLGTIRIQGAESNAISARQAQQLTSLAQAVAAVTNSMEDEQSSLAIYIGEGRPEAQGSLLFAQGQAAVTGQLINQAYALVRRGGPELGPRQRASLSALLLSQQQRLNTLRASAERGQSPALDVIEAYSAQISALLSAGTQIVSGIGDPVAARDVRVFGALQQAVAAQAQERSILDAALNAGQFRAGEQAALSQARLTEQANMAVFNGQATQNQQHAFQATVRGSAVDRANAMLAQALTPGPNAGLTVTVPPRSPFSTVQLSWDQDMGFTVDQMRRVEQGLLASITARGQALHGQAARVIVQTWTEMGVVVLAVLAFAVPVARRRSRARGFHPAAG